MHYVTILVLLQHANKEHQKVKITQPHKPDVIIGEHTIRSHVVAILGAQLDPTDTPFQVLDMYHKVV